VLVNGRWLPPAGAAIGTDSPCVALVDDEVAYAVLGPEHLVYCSANTVEDCIAAWKASLPHRAAGGRLFRHVWEIVDQSPRQIVADWKQAPVEYPPAAVPLALIGPGDRLAVSPTATVEPFVVADTSAGPVVIGPGSIIGSFSRLEGPCYIGKHVTLTALSLIHGGTSIGPMCKIGGETANAIFLGYSNKAHAGFVGHSYVGEWVNLGADTTTSNLKVTYGPIKMRIGGREIITDRRFLGSMIGDHTKTAIGTRLMSGSYIGFCSLLAASKLPPQFIPSFSFWTDKGMETYRREKAREVMAQVYSRRGRNWNEEDEKIVDYVAATAAGIEK